MFPFSNWKIESDMENIFNQHVWLMLDGVFLKVLCVWSLDLAKRQVREPQVKFDFICFLDSISQYDWKSMICIDQKTDVNLQQCHQYWDKLHWIIWKILTASIYIKMRTWIRLTICNVLEPGLFRFTWSACHVSANTAYQEHHLFRNI